MSTLLTISEPAPPSDTSPATQAERSPVSPAPAVATDADDGRPRWVWDSELGRFALAPSRAPMCRLSTIAYFITLHEQYARNGSNASLHITPAELDDRIQRQRHRTDSISGES